MNESETSNTYYRALDLTERFAVHLMQDKNNHEILKDIPPYIKCFNDSLYYSDTRNSIYKKYLSKVESALTELDCNEILGEFEKDVEQINADKDSRKCTKQKQLLNLIEKYSSENNDEEIQTISENINTVDPITKLVIVEPVKNVKCGHVYEKSSIMKLIKMKSKTKCPIPGCVASDFVRPQDLVSDHALKRLLSENISQSSPKKIKIHNISG